MPKAKEHRPKKKEELKDGFYKGYDIRWLKKNPEHSDFKLVAECEAKYGKIE